MQSQPLKKTGDNTTSLPTLLDRWLDKLVADDRSTHTVRSYGQAVQRFLTWYAEEERRPLTLDDLTPIALIAHRNHLQHGQGQARSTVNTRIAALRSWCAWLYETGHLPDDPARRLKFIGGETNASSPEGLKDTQVNALLRESQRTRHPTRDYAIVQMLLQTGMRIGECAALNYEDIVLGERSGSVTIRGGKGNKARLIPLNGSARKALAEYAAPCLGVAPSPAAVSAAWPHRDPALAPTPLWQSQKRHRLSISAIRTMVDALVRNCALRGLVPPDASAHTLRHTFAQTYLADNPGDLIGLATLLGHSSLDTTRIYGQPTAEQLAARVDRLKVNAYQD